MLYPALSPPLEYRDPRTAIELMCEILHLTLVRVKDT